MWGTPPTPPACSAFISLFAELHELVKPKGVGEAVDGVELAGDKHALEYLVIGQTCASEGIDILIGHLVRVFRELHAQPEQRLVLLLDWQRLDIRSFGSLRRLLTPSYRPQEK